MDRPAYYKQPIPEGILRPLYERGLTQQQIAERLGTNEKKVAREQKRWGLVPKMTQDRIRNSAPELVNRARLLLADGQPANWVAEDTGMGMDALHDLAQTVEGHKQATREWQVTWPTIRNNQIILELHRQFAPKRSSR